MKTVLRGTDASKAIFEKSRKITEERKGESTPRVSSPIIERGGGAYASLMNRNRVVQENKPNEVPELPYETVKKIDVSKYFDSLYESLTLLKETRDYSTVVRGLLTYYLAGNLGQYVIEGITKEDKSEILGIIKDFENTIKNTL